MGIPDIEVYLSASATDHPATRVAATCSPRAPGRQREHEHPPGVAAAVT
jgi:hypothetical protein